MSKFNIYIIILVFSVGLEKNEIEYSLLLLSVSNINGMNLGHALKRGSTKK